MEKEKFKERYGDVLEMLCTDEDSEILKHTIKDWAEHYCRELDK